MLVALIAALVLWSHPAPQLYICNPGKTPTGSTPSNCERVHLAVLGRWRLP